MTWEECVCLWAGRAVLWSGGAWLLLLLLDHAVSAALRRLGVWPVLVAFLYDYTRRRNQTKHQREKH